MNGLDFVQVRPRQSYSGADFDEDLKRVLMKAGAKGEKVCFAIDEADLTEPSMLERMNTLLANAEIAGLFEGEDLNTLHMACRDLAYQKGITLKTQDDVYEWFRRQVIDNLHVVFTMNPPISIKGLREKMTTSPALFNRCVISWMDCWSHDTYRFVASGLVGLIDIRNPLFSSASGEIMDAVSLAAVAMLEGVMQIINEARPGQSLDFTLTPQHFLEFLRQFSLMYKKKRGAAEEYQDHVIKGLNQLDTTIEDVAALKRILTNKEAMLSLKTKQAEEKLEKMVHDQQNAENQKAASLKLQKEIESQEAAISQRQQEVSEELDQVEPLIENAKESVSNIKRTHLQELRAMQNPPEAVKLTMESVCILLGHRVDSWKSVQSVTRKDDFISSITNYDTSLLSSKIRLELEATYMAHKSFSFEIVNRASKACGPLLQWVVAQIRYAAILDKVGPLRIQVEELESKAVEARAQALSTQKLLTNLENQINIYRKEYSDLISEIEKLKKELESVNSKMKRSIRLIEGLSSEKARWETSR